MLDAGCFGLLAVWAPRLCDMVVAEAGEAEGVWQTEVAVAKVVVAVMSVAVKAAPVAAVTAVGRWCCDSDASSGSADCDGGAPAWNEAKRGHLRAWGSGAVTPGGLRCHHGPKSMA